MTVGCEEVTLWGIVEEHLEEASFLYGMRSARFQAPHYNLDEIHRGPEARLLAHIDGLVVAGSEARDRLLIPVLRDEEAEPESVAAASLAMLNSEHPHLSIELLAACLANMQGTRLEALAAALALSESPEVSQLLARELQKEHSPAATAAMLRVLAAHRTDSGVSLVSFLDSRDAQVTQAALAVVASVPRPECLPWCERLIESDVVETRNRAIDAALVLGSTLAWSVCIHRAARPTGDDAHCLLLSGLLGSAQEQKALVALLEGGTQVEAVLWAMGFAGRPEHLQALVSMLGQPEERIAKLAGEAFTAVTAYAPPKRAPAAKDAGSLSAPEEAPLFEEEDLDADLAPTTIDLLPILDRASAQAWWDQNRVQFAGGTRYVQGQPMSVAAIHHALRNGPARRRQPWALALMIASGGACVVSTDALCQRQLAQLAGLARFDASALRWLFR